MSTSTATALSWKSACTGVLSPTAAQVFDHARTLFDRAGATTAHSVSFQLAGHIVRIRFAGAGLRSLLTPAFAHLPSAGDLPADLTICCWDDASTGVEMAEPDGRDGQSGMDFMDGPVRIAWEHDQQCFSAFWIAKQFALLRFPNALALPSWERAAPLRRILHWWASTQGLQLVHAAALGDCAGGVLLVGKGGSGKSTTALACIGTSIGYAGDDYCLVSLDGGPRVHALYCSGKADAGSAARLPRLKATFAASTLHGEGKSVIFVPKSAIVVSFPLQAIVVPKIADDADCRLDPLSRAAALRALAPSTLFQMPGDRRESWSRLAALIRKLPCWQLTVGPDPAAAHNLLSSLFSAGRLLGGQPQE